MSNLTDALIAAKLMGNGGGGGGGGLPPITIETTTIVEEQTVTGFQNAGGVYLGIGGSVSFASVGAGDLVDVIFDGITYHTSAKEEQGIVVIGNVGIMGNGEDTGEPFILMDSYPYSPGDLTVITNKTGTSHTVEASASVSSPKSGSILIVKDGEWATEELSALIPLVFCTVIASGDFTVSAGSIYTTRHLTIDITVGVPAGWTKGMALAVTQATNGNHDVTDALIVSADFDFENSEISYITIYNPTSSSISFSGLIFAGGIAKNA